MVDDDRAGGCEGIAGHSAQAEHPDPAAPTGMMRLDRAAFYGQIPPWPPSMIEPSDTERTRWNDLWRHPKAAEWIEANREHTVVQLVRIEQVNSASRRSRQARADLDRLRRDLGLTD